MPENKRRVLDALRGMYTSGVRDLLPHRVKVALRACWLVLARRVGYPISSPQFPRPRLAPGRKPFSLGRVLLACDLNRDYLDFWPSTRLAWKEIVGLDAVLVLVAPHDEIPDELREDAAVIPFEPIEGVHSTFQAQCIRLLYPALLDTDGAVIISDMDLYPLRASYFHEPVKRIDERFFVVYRDDRLNHGEIAVGFNAALPRTWREVFDVATIEDVRTELARWANGLRYDGRRGWDGWYTDQHRLYERLLSWPARNERLWVLDDQYSRYRRLDRMYLAGEAGLKQRRIEAIRRCEYSDFNCFVPYREHRAINDRVLELAVEAARGR
jgi:hypothetical protein